jgi:hypothetical protein
MLFKGSVVKPFPTADMAFQFARTGYSTFALYPDPDPPGATERIVWLVRGEMVPDPRRPWGERVPVYTLREDETCSEAENLQAVCQGMPRPHNRHRACAWGLWAAICGMFSGSDPHPQDRMTLVIQDWKLYDALVRDLPAYGPLVQKVRQKLREHPVTLHWIPDMEKDRREDLPEFDPTKFADVQKLSRPPVMTAETTDDAEVEPPRADGGQPDPPGRADGLGGAEVARAEE